MNAKQDVSGDLMQELLKAQRNEMTEHAVYLHIARAAPTGHNRKVLETIAKEEKQHALFWQSKTGRGVGADPFLVFFYTASARLMGFTFAVKLMEKGEKLAQINYAKIARIIPGVRKIEEQEEEHEMKLLRMLDEEQLQYVGSMILGVNDALVELTGTLAGLTFALGNPRLIALAGTISGIAASLSMGGSEYLSTKAENQGRNPVRAALYTGVTYFLTVILLITPYLLIPQVFVALAVTLAAALLIIVFFAFYMAVAQEAPFKRRVAEMAAISMGVAAFTFILGYILRRVFDIVL